MSQQSQALPNKKFDASNRLRDDFVRFGNSLVQFAALNFFPPSGQLPTACNSPPSQGDQSTAAALAQACNPTVQTVQSNSSGSSDEGENGESFKEEASQCQENDKKADMIWPNGNTDFEVPKLQMSMAGQGIAFHFGWSFCCTNTKVIKGAFTRRYLHCLGVFKCSNHQCQFVARPLQPKKKTKGAVPLPPKHVCPMHPNQSLEFVQCKCTMSLDLHEDHTMARHTGLHDHPRPPLTKPSPEAIRELEAAVLTNPSAGPAKLRMGVPGRKAMPDVSDAFVNQDRLAHHRRKILQGTDRPGHSHGIRPSTAALFDFAKDLGHMKSPFFKDVCMDPQCMSITMQTPSMEKALAENTSGLQSDTLEGAIHENDFDGEISLHFTSCFDPICDRWVPVLITLLFGKSMKHFGRHWQLFFGCYNNCKSWADFEQTFCGITMDWSDALGSSFLLALCDFSSRFPDGKLTEDQAQAFVRKCGVHFKRSVIRVARIRAVVGDDDGKDTFLNLVSQMTSSGTTPVQFVRVCKQIFEQFPSSVNWLKWYLNPKRAASFFPAVQNFSPSEAERWNKLHSSTNGQENLGGLFKHLFMGANKLTINETVLSVFKFATRFDTDRSAVMSGLPTKYGQCPRTQNKKGRKGKRSRNDGRPPDKNSTLFPRSKKKARRAASKEAKASLSVSQDNRFAGPKWAFTTASGAHMTNTCPLDAFLMSLFAPAKGKAMINPLCELSDPSSLVATTFQHMEAHKWNAARLHWYDKWFNHDITESRNWWGSVQEQFSGDRRGMGPLEQSFRIKYHQMVRCMNNNCPSKQLSNEVIPDELKIPGSTLALTMLDGQTVTDCIAMALDDSVKKVCQISQDCGGPSFYTKAEIVQWPRLLCIDTTSNSLDKIAFVSRWGGKKFVLRSAVLCDNFHFTALTRMPKGWMHNDGIDRPMFTFYDLEDIVEACRGRLPALTMFEVLDDSDTREFLDPNHDWRDTFVGTAAVTGFTGTPNFQNDKGNSNSVMDDKGGDDGGRGRSQFATPRALLQSLKAHISQGTQSSRQTKAETTTKRKAKADKKQDRRKSRKMMGWSIPASSPKRGPLPTCKGCGQKIERHEHRVRHKFESEKDPTIKPIWQYHLKSSCLLNMSGEHMSSFLAKKFSSKGAQICQAMVAKFAFDD